jgi:hypothetical protein
MATTTSNQDLGITTTSSDHVVQTQGPTDMNWNPPVKVVVPHGNQVPTTAATEHTTDRTQFGGGSVVRVGDAVGPSSGPAHPDNGAGGGVCSATHLQEARVVTGSPNVRTEGGPPARSTDPATNNHGNTPGVVQGANPTAEVPQTEEEKLLACSLDTIVVACGHGRKPGREKLLEITSADTVKLEATRKNAKTGGAPECSQPPHTKWVIRHTKDGRLVKQENKDGDVLELDNSWFTWDDLDGGQPDSDSNLEVSADRSSGPAPIDEQRLRDRTRAENERLRTSRPGLNEVDANTRQQGRATPGAPRVHRQRQESRRELVEQFAQRERARAEGTARRLDRAGNAAADAVNLGNAANQLYKGTKDIAEFFKVWNADKVQNEVTVEAFACSGGDKFVFRSFPGKEIELNLGDYVEQVRSVVQAIQRVFRGIQQVATLAGTPVSADAKLLDPFDVTVACGWEELTQANAAIRKYPHHVDRLWNFQVATTLAEVDCRLTIPIAMFANLFIPGAGRAISSALNFIGFEANIRFSASVSISVAVWGDKPAGASRPTFGGGFPIKIELAAAVDIRWRTNVEVTGEMVVEGEPTFDLVVPSTELFDTYLRLRAGEFKFGFKGVAKAEISFFRRKIGGSWDGEYFPEATRVAWDEMPLRIFSMLKR